MGRKDQIGFSQRIQLSWLEETANLILAGQKQEEIQIYLQDLLKDQLSVGGTATRGNREKAITILMKIWVNVPDGFESLKKEGLELIQSVPVDEHMAVHWGMATAVYPFWASVAASVGRLLRLQGTVSTIQAQRRVREQYGERETVARAARRVLRTFIDWGVLEETGKKGIYQVSRFLMITDRRLISWFVETSLIASGESSGTLSELVNNPALFPFQIPLQDISAFPGKRIEIIRHSLDENLVLLKEK